MKSPIVLFREMNTAIPSSSAISVKYTKNKNLPFIKKFLQIVANEPENENYPNIIIYPAFMI